MTSDTTSIGQGPIACALPTDALTRRIVDLAALSDRALRSRHAIDGGERLTFAAGDGVERDLRAVIAAEASCCSFLTMTLDATGDDEFVLDITGPPDARALIAAMFAPSA